MHSEAQRIAAKLNEAQREAILLYEGPREDNERLRRMLAMLKDSDLREIRDLGLATKASVPRRISSRLTPLGLAVRQALKPVE